MGLAAVTFAGGYSPTGRATIISVWIWLGAGIAILVQSYLDFGKPATAVEHGRTNPRFGDFDTARA